MKPPAAALLTLVLGAAPYATFAATFQEAGGQAGRAADQEPPQKEEYFQGDCKVETTTDREGERTEARKCRPPRPPAKPEARHQPAPQKPVQYPANDTLPKSEPE